MAHIRNLTNRAYISNSLKESLGRFEMYRYSFILHQQATENPKSAKLFLRIIQVTPFFG